VYYKKCNSVVFDLFRKIEFVHSRFTRSACCNFFVFPCRTNVRKNFAVNRGVTLWNGLDRDIKTVISYCIFKRMLKTKLFDAYN
jgi:hypothetical protein